MAFITMLGFSISVTLARKEKVRSMLPALSIGLLLSGVVLVMFIDPFQFFYKSRRYICFMVSPWPLQ